ncbi:MAG: VOC family protein [Bacteroidia bacterium]|nr:VOC family protein [Bacteroidia bacterium]
MFPASISLSFGNFLITLSSSPIILPIHHIVLGVKNLSEAVAEFEAQGFTLSEGGQHQGGFSHNALIHFEDGSFLELFAFRSSLKVALLRLADRLGLLEKMKAREKMGHMPRFMKCLHGEEGIMDFAMLVHDIDKYKDRVSYEDIGPAIPFSRIRPDGSEISWKLAFPTELKLPFLMSPYQPPQEVPEDKRKHSNGALGIRQLDIIVQNWDNHFQSFLRFLDTTPQIGREAKEPKASFMINKQHILLKSTSDARFCGIHKIHLLGAQGEKKEINLRNILIDIHQS